MSASLASLNEIHSKQRALEMLGFFLINFKNSELLPCLYVKKNLILWEKSSLKVYMKVNPSKFRFYGEKSSKNNAFFIAYCFHCFQSHHRLHEAFRYVANRLKIIDLSFSTGAFDSLAFAIPPSTHSTVF